jgi:hypothetical protein
MRRLFRQETPELHQVAQAKDWLARWTGIAGFVLALATLYFAVLRPACLKVGLGPKVYIASKPRIGILATVVNEGAREAIITSGELRLDNSQFTLPLTEISLQPESWEYDAEGNFQKRSSIRFSPFMPFAIKPNDQASVSLWFVAHDAFPLSPGRHIAEMVLTDVQQKRVQIEFQMELLQSDLNALYEKKNGTKQEGIEYSIKVVSQTQKTGCSIF